MSFCACKPRLAMLPIGRDLRTRAQIQTQAAKNQSRADEQIEAEWQRRVSQNIRRRVVAGIYPRDL